MLLSKYQREEEIEEQKGSESESQNEMEVAQSALWYVRECKESDDESRGKRFKSKKREDINKSGEGGKSSNILSVCQCTHTQNI